MQEIKKFIDQIYPMSDSDWNFFSSKLRQEKLNKNSTLTKIGTIENYLSFISEGIVRFYIPQEESELTFGFLFENEFVTAYDSFITQTTSHYQIETLTNATLCRISYKDLQEVYKEILLCKVSCLGTSAQNNQPLVSIPSVFSSYRQRSHLPLTKGRSPLISTMDI